MQADLSAPSRYRGRAAAGGPSAWMIAGYVLLAVSLVAVGAVVVLDSVDLPAFGAGGPAPAPTPGPPAAKPTPNVIVVARQDQGQPGVAPTTAPAADPTAPSLLLPPGGSAPIFGVPTTTPGGGAAPADAASPATQPNPSTATQPEPSPATSEAAGSPVPGGQSAANPGASPVAAGAPVDPRALEALDKLTTAEDLVGQLFLLAWVGNTAEGAGPALRDLRAGGIVFIQNASTGAEAATINQGLQRIAGGAGVLPPLTAIDHEGGLVQRLRGDIRRDGDNWELGQRGAGAQEACERGVYHGQELKKAGFTMNLAPVLDVNNNPANPVIGRRSYSADPEVVARLGAAYIRGLQSTGLAAVGKHFPGHGNTSVDSHLSLPSLPQSIEDLDRIELVPFKRAIEHDVAGIMSAHIVFPALEPSGSPATLSRSIMTGLLREKLGFKGLAVSDDMGAMRAITDNYGAGDAAVMAIKAGVDLIIMSAEVPRQRAARDAVLAHVASGDIPRDRLQQAVLNVLQVKARVGLLGGPAATTPAPCT